MLTLFCCYCVIRSRCSHSNRNDKTSIYVVMFMSVRHWCEAGALLTLIYLFIYVVLIYDLFIAGVTMRLMIRLLLNQQCTK